MLPGSADHGGKAFEHLSKRERKATELCMSRKPVKGSLGEAEAATAPAASPAPASTCDSFNNDTTISHEPASLLAQKHLAEDDSTYESEQPPQK